MSELLDIVNSKDEVIGQATRQECHSNPKLLHRVSLCCIFNSKNQILLQKRSKNKKDGAGYWDLAAGGHVQSGLTAKQGMLQELKEELNIENTSLTLVDKYVRNLQSQSEMVNLYFTIIDKAVEAFTFQKEEIDELKWFEYDVLITKHEKREIDLIEFVPAQLAKIYAYRVK